MSENEKDETVLLETNDTFKNESTNKIAHQNVGDIGTKISLRSHHLTHFISAMLGAIALVFGSMSRYRILRMLT